MANPETDKMNEYTQRLNDWVASVDTSDLPLPIYNDDGQINYSNVARLLTGDEFAEYRENNPDVFSQAKTNAAVDAASAGISLAGDVAKFGFAMRQLNEAKDIDDTPPSYAPRPNRNPALRRSLADSYAASQQGLTAAERAVYDAQSERDFSTQAQRIQNTSGGQAGATQANMQLAADQQRLARLRQIGTSEQVRRQNRAESNRLAGLSLQEDYRQQEYNRNKFLYRDRPVWQEKMAAKRDLRAAGINNAFGAADSFGRHLIQTGNLFKGNLPKNVYRSDIGDLLDPIYNNSAQDIIDLPDYDELAKVRNIA